MTDRQTVKNLAAWHGASVAREIAAHTKTAWADVTGKSRRGRLMIVRRAIAERLRRDCKLSLPQIGRILNRHHTTIINMLKGVHENA